MEETHSSDSSSAGVVDVTNVSPSSQPVSGRSAGTENDLQHTVRSICSVERRWATIGSSLNGVGFLQDEEFDCEVPDEFLDVSCQSDHLSHESHTATSEEDNEKKKEGEEEASGGGREEGCEEEGAVKPQMCVWVPPECCLIPLPTSPENRSEEEEEGGRKGNDEKKRKGELGREGIRRVLSESELHRQCKKELEDLLGFRPPPPPPPSSPEREFPPPPSSPSSSSPQMEAHNSGNSAKDPVRKETNGASVPTNMRANSTDSGVSDISTRSVESDLEQRQSRMGMRSGVGGKGVRSMGCRGGGKGRPASRPTEQRPVSKLKTPSEKLRNCSVFSASPVVCSELNDLREASCLPPQLSFHLPPSPDYPSAQHACTFVVTPPTLTTHPSPPHPTLSQQEVQSVRAFENCKDGKNVLRISKGGREGEGKGRGGGNVSSTSTVSSSSSTGSGNNGPSQQNPGLKRIPSKLTKPATHKTFGYKAAPNALPYKGKKPPAMLKSLLPAARAGAAANAPPSQLQRPNTTLVPHKGRVKGALLAPHTGPVAPSACVARKTGPVKPTRRGLKKTLDPTKGNVREAGANKKPTSSGTDQSVAKEVNRIPRGAVKPVGRASSSRPSSPAKAKVAPKLPRNGQQRCHQQAPSVASSPTQTTSAAQGETLSTSVVSTSACSPSTQHSTPMTHHSKTITKQQRGGTVVKESRSGEGKGQGEGGTEASECTPHNLVGSTPSRRLRPKLSLSSIDSDGADCPSQPALRETFTLPRDPDTVQPPVTSTPQTDRKKRRSLIPTPVRMDNGGKRYADVPPLSFSSDATRSPLLQKQSLAGPTTAAQGGGSGVAGCSTTVTTSHVPAPKTRRPLISRNKMATGSWRLQSQRERKGPVKPLPPVIAAKMVHSPADKENVHSSPHSEWSPVRRKVVTDDDACFQCTKRTVRNDS